ncbi:MAG: YraN family protein [Nitriliruptoraceae bacterium]
MDTTTHHEPLSAAALAGVTDLPVGRLGEGLAARHLGIDGLEVLARNWRVAEGELRGELDLIAVERATSTLVVCEVKTRRDADRFGGACAALDPRKHRRLRALTAAFLRAQPHRYAHVRLDLVAIDLGRCAGLTHLVGLA